MRNFRFYTIILPVVGLLILVVAIILISNQIDDSQSIEDTSAVSSSSSLQLIESTPDILLPGEEVTISLQADFIATDAEVRTGRIVLDFDNDILRLLEIIEGQDILSSNESISNGSGTTTIDIVHEGPGNFPVNEDLLIYRFELLSSDFVSTSVSINPLTTFGSPNTLISDLPSIDIDVTAPLCGDGNVDKPNGQDIIEVCDDGNNSNGDRCSSDCKVYCREGFVYDGRVCVDYSIESNTETTPTQSSTPTPTQITPTQSSSPTPTQTVEPTSTEIAESQPTQTTSPTPTVEVQETDISNIEDDNQPPQAEISTEEAFDSSDFYFYGLVIFAFFTGSGAIYFIIKE